MALITVDGLGPVCVVRGFPEEQGGLRAKKKQSQDAQEAEGHPGMQRSQQVQVNEAGDVTRPAERRWVYRQPPWLSVGLVYVGKEGRR